MAYLDDADFRYLGKPINTESSEVDSRRLIEEKLQSLLEALDTSLSGRLSQSHLLPISAGDLLHVYLVSVLALLAL